jgi:hypothetical protein
MLTSYIKGENLTSRIMHLLFLAFLLTAGLANTASATCTIHGGAIGNPQTGCSPFDPSMITNVTSVSSPYGGPFEYLWLKTTDPNAVAGTNTNWTSIANSNVATYDPGSLTETTWFRRCVRRAVSICPNFDGESNWIKITVHPAINATITASSTITQGQSKTLTATGGGTYAWSTGATSASVTVSPATTTTYSVTVSNNGCSVVRSSTVTVTPAVGVLTFPQPGNITMTAPAGQTSMIVTYPNPTASSTCAIGSVTVTRISGPASGSSFPVGSTQVCYRATDGCGNQLERCFTIVVNAGAPAFDCTPISIVTGSGNITISGLNTAVPITIIQVSDANWNQVFNQYYATSPGSVTVPNLASGQYFVKVQYATAAWAEICKKEGFFTVVGAPVLPSISVNDVTVNENAGTATLQICASAASASPITVTYTTANGSAASGSDYAAATGTATIPAGQLCATVTINITDDNTTEPTESFSVNLTNPTGATIADNAGTVTITDNDNAPAADCSPITIQAGNGNITVGGLSTQPIIIIQVSDASWNQVFNQYYTSNPGTVTIPNLAAGQYFVKVQYATAAWAELCKKEGFFTVTGAPVQPSLSINDVTVNENAGTATLQICASAASASPITVNYSTANGSAVSGGDYAASTGTATIPAGQLCATVTVNITDDNTNEPTESFTVNLSGANGATIADNAGTVTITDNDAAPGGNCDNISAVAGNGNIVVNGVSGPITSIQVFDASWNTVFNQYYTNQPGTVTIPSLGAGTYYVKVDFYTAAWSPICQKQFTVTVGGNPNTGTLTFPQPGNVTVTAAQGAGTAVVNYPTPTASTTCTATGPVTVSLLSGLASGSSFPVGTSQVCYRAVDACNNQIDRCFTVTVNAPAPVGTLTFPQPGNITVAAAPGANSAVVNYSTPTASTTCTATGPVTVSLLSGLASGSSFPVGTSQVCYRAVDACNNQIDRCFNVIVTAAPAGNCDNVTAVAGNGTITVGGVTAPITSVQVFNASWNTVFNQYYTNQPGTVTVPSLPAGVYYVKVDYYTAAWSPICQKQLTVTVTGAPTGVLTFAQPGNISVTAAPGAGSASVTYPTPTASTTCTATGPVTVSLLSGLTSGSSFPVGTSQVCYRAVDACNNQIDRCFTVTVVAGTPVGVLTFGQPGNITVTAAPGQTAATVTYPTPGASSTCTVGSVTVTRISGGASGTSFTGTSQVCYRATDGCGNQIDRCFTVTVHPGAPVGVLTFGQPGNITVTAAAGQTAATVTYPTPGASSTCTVGSVTVTRISGGASGTSFTGTSQVCYRATDGCGNQIERCFTVTVHPGAPVFPDPNACYRIVNKESGFAIDADNYPWLTQRPVDHTSSQSWKLVSDGAGYFYIKSNATANNGKVVDIQNGSTADGAYADLVTQTGAACEKFSFQSAGGGFFYLVAKHSGKALKLNASPGVDGTQIIQQTISSTNEHQKWKFEVSNCTTFAANAPTAAISLSAQRNANQVNLRWMSTTGTQNASYIVERSANGGQFEIIATANATSQDDIVYFNEVDNAPAKAENVYRVRMILKDASERISNNQMVFMPEVGSFGMYPNPAVTSVSVDVSEFAGQDVKVQLFNQLGKLVQTVEVAASNGIIELDLNDMQSGFYGVSITSNGVSRSSKLVVAKN